MEMEDYIHLYDIDANPTQKVYCGQGWHGRISVQYHFRSIAANNVHYIVCKQCNDNIPPLQLLAGISL